MWGSEHCNTTKKLKKQKSTRHCCYKIYFQPYDLKVCTYWYILNMTEKLIRRSSASKSDQTRFPESHVLTNTSISQKQTAQFSFFDTWFEKGQTRNGRVINTDMTKPKWNFIHCITALENNQDCKTVCPPLIAGIKTKNIVAGICLLS